MIIINKIKTISLFRSFTSFLIIFIIIITINGCSGLGSWDQIRNQIQNSQTSVPTISINDVITNPESNTISTFTVTLSQTSEETITVDYNTADVSATNGNDYTGIGTTTLTFNPGELTKTIDVTILDDAVFESGSIFNVNLSNPLNATILDGTGVGTIIDDETIPTVSINDVTTNPESNTTASFTVTLSHASEEIITVNYNTANGTATAGNDYSSISSTTLTFSPGELTKTIDVAILDDTVFESNENYSVNLSSPNNVIISDGTAIGTIVDNDTAPNISIDDVTINPESGTTATFTVTLSQICEQTITVNYNTTNGTATAGSDYSSISSTTLTFNPGELTKTIDVAILDDAVYEGNETFNITLSVPVNVTILDGTGIGTIIDNETIPTISINDVTTNPESNTTASFIVNLSHPSQQTITVNYNTANGTATAGSDYSSISSTTLTFNPGELTKTIDVTILDDAVYEGNETFNITLSVPVNATILDETGIGTIIDNETMPTISINDVTTNPESNTTATFTVTLSHTSEQIITVNYNTANGTATAGSDYSGISSTTLIFNPGELTKWISVTILDDAVYEGDETFNVTLSVPVNVTILDGTGIGTIIDNEAIPTISINDVTINPESNPTASFTVTLSNASDEIITVNYNTANGTATAGSDYSSISSTTLTFNPGELTKTIDVTILDDAIDEGDETFNVILSAPVNATILEGSGTGTIVDNDLAPNISINDVTINPESNTTATFTVTLSQVSEKIITVNYNTADVSATNGSDYTAIGTTTLTFNPGELTKTINVTILDDVIDESDETFNISLSMPVNTTILDGIGTGTIVDNDADAAFANADTIGQQIPVTVGSVEFKMIYVNDSTSINFPVGTTDFFVPTLTRKFFMAETETTNALFVEVYQWAKDAGKFNTIDVNTHNGLDNTTAKHGTQQLIDLDDPDCQITYDGTFSVEPGYENHPVTHVTWYGATMFVNWLTEMRDGNTDNVVHTNINETWVKNDTIDYPDRTGYRLPTKYEWEYTARYRGTDTTNTVTGIVDGTDFDAMTIKWTKGNSASGATSDKSDVTANRAVAVYGNSDPVPTDDVEVKSLGIDSKNFLGLYDMSGNVGERLANAGADPPIGGGDWSQVADYLPIGWSPSKPADYSSGTIGFRICRTQ